MNGVRRGFTDYQPYEKNLAFVPEVRGVPFGQQYPTQLRDILVKNGILNPDYTPNEATAKELGWILQDPADVPLMQRYWLSQAERTRLINERYARQDAEAARLKAAEAKVSGNAARLPSIKEGK